MLEVRLVNNGSQHFSERVLFARHWAEHGTWFPPLGIIEILPGNHSPYPCFTPESTEA